VIGNVTRVVQASAELSAQPVGGTGSSWWLVTGVADQVNLIEGDWHEAVDTARYALAAELMGVCRRALSTAVEHVRIRSQFGRPIGSYQSVRHRLAEAHAQLTGTESLLTSVGNDLDHWSAATVKSMAGFTHTSVVRHCLQVCGAMGLSEEHLLPRCVRRGHLIDLMLGSAGAIARDQGAELLLGREPPLITVI
jgi:alkylation response protein AidB-like acyl-CoA dehydrogenase